MLISCGEDEMPVCERTGANHSGCCSSHGGFEELGCDGQDGSYFYSNKSGSLLCNDGTYSPSCTH